MSYLLHLLLAYGISYQSSKASINSTSYNGSDNKKVSNFQGDGSPVAQLSSTNKDLDLEAGQIDSWSDTSTGALEDIAFKCGTKV